MVLAQHLVSVSLDLVVIVMTVLDIRAQVLLRLAERARWVAQRACRVSAWVPLLCRSQGALG